MDYFAKQSNKNKDRYNKILNYYQSLDLKIIQSKMFLSQFTYIIFDPIICLNFKFLLDFISKDQSNNFKHPLSIQIIELIVKEYEKLKTLQLVHNQLSLENILICTKDPVPFLKIQNIKIIFFNFQNDEPQTNTDEQQIFYIIKNLIKDKLIQMNNFEENLSQCKNLKDIRDKIINYNKTNNDQMKFNLINPSRLEYFYKVNQIFKKKQLKNNYVEFIEQLIWQNYYYYSLKFEQKDYELYSIQKKIDKKIQIYQTAQKQLQNYLIQELRFLNQFHQSLYRDNYEEIIFGENIQKEYEEKMKINFQYEYYQILKTYFQDSKNLEGYIKKQIQNKLQYLWQQHQKMIFDQYLKQATTLIISNITELTGNYPVEQQF